LAPVSRPLQFKRRVHLPADSLFEPAVKRRSNPAYLGAVAWLTFTASSYLLIQRWLTHDGPRVARADVLLVPQAGDPSLAAPQPEPAIVPSENEQPPPDDPEPPLDLQATDESFDAGAQDPGRLEAARAEIAAAEALEKERERERELAREREQGRERELARERERLREREREWERERLRERERQKELARQQTTRPTERTGRRTPTEEKDEPSQAPQKVARTTPPAVPKPAPAPSEEPIQPTRASGGSCEAAIAAYKEEVDLRRRNQTPDISASTYAGILNNGSYFAHCGVPASLRISICAAVQRGRAIGVTVQTNPARPSAERCIQSAVRRLRFPSHPKLDVTRTVFAPH
jgi:hypothetical protein